VQEFTAHSPLPSALDPSHDNPGPDSLEGLARVLTATGDYRVLRRFQPRRRYTPPADIETPLRAVFVDVEATGLDTFEDRIIELAAVPFTFDRATGRIGDVHEPFVALEDPERPIPDEIIELTGIDDDMVRGQRIDDDALGALLADAVLVVAHNASYDRQMLERRFPLFAEKHWACSHADVPWARLGCRGTKLDYLLLERCAEFFDAHRAEHDCLAGIHVLATPCADGTLPFQRLLDAARTPRHRLWAIGAPIEIKDTLKKRRYRWHPGDAQRPKAWYRDCTPAELADESAWLETVAYAGRQPAWRTEKITAKDRYSIRA
jgi:DNA polymerase-3 subunit epsilon